MMARRDDRRYGFFRNANVQRAICRRRGFADKLP